MATVQEIKARWDEIDRLKAQQKAAKRREANDNAPREPDYYIVVDGKPMSVWLPPGVTRDTPIEGGSA